MNFIKKTIFLILFLFTKSVFAQKTDTLFISALKYYQEEQKLQENIISELKKKANTKELIIDPEITNFLKSSQSISQIWQSNSQNSFRFESENRKYWTNTPEKQEKKKKKRKKKKSL